MEIDAQKRLHGPWHYDQVIDFIEGTIANVKKYQKDGLADLKRIEASLKRAPKQQRSRLEDLRRRATELITESKYDLNFAEEEKARMHSSKPVLIGPATLDSLIDNEPEQWEYIDTERLPFDDLFFDLVRPIEIGIPVSNVSGMMIGISMNKLDAEQKIEALRRRDITLRELDQTIEMESSPYSVNAFLKSSFCPDLINLPFTFQSFKTRQNDQRQLFVTGEYQLPNNPLVKFLIDPLRKEFLANLNDTEKMKAREVKYKRMPFDSVPFRETLERLPRLCVNLVNYINAHNVTVISLNRKPRLVKRGNKFVEEPSSIKPFYLVTIRDGLAEDDREEGKSWELNWRVYVRGHPVKYRDENGEIYLTTWRRPHIRGPPDAPWRDQRYEVLAKKLEEEKAMQREFGIFS